MDRIHHVELRRQESQPVEMRDGFGEGPDVPVQVLHRQFELQAYSPRQQLRCSGQHLLLEALRIDLLDDGAGRIVHQFIQRNDSHCLGGNDG